MKIKYLSAIGAAATLLSVIPVSRCSAQHIVDGYFTSPSEWDTSRPAVTTQSYAAAPDGSGSSQLYAEHVYPANPSNPNSYDMLYLMADYTGSAPGATNSNTQFTWFFRESALYCQGDYLITFGANGFSEYEQNYYDTVQLNPDGSFYLGAGSGWGSLDARDLADGNIQAAEGYGTSPNDATDHLMAEVGIAIYEPYDHIFWQGVVSPSPPTFFSFSTTSAGGDPVVAAGYVTLNPGGSTSISLTDPENPGNSVEGQNGDLSLLAPDEPGIIVGVPEGGPISLFMGFGFAISFLLRQSIQRRKLSARYEA